MSEVIFVDTERETALNTHRLHSVVSHNIILSANEQLDFTTLIFFFFCSFTDKILNSLASIKILFKYVEHIMKRSKMSSQFFVIFLFLIPFIGCQKDDNITNNSSSISLVPLKVGNQWIYRNTKYDTLGNVQGIFVDTVKINGDTTIENVNWYQIDSDSTFYANKFNGFWVMYVYSSGPISSTQSLIAKYPAEVMDYWPIPLGIQVQLLDIGSNYSVPAGQYSYYQYSYTDTAKHTLLQYQYFSPGTGMIREENYFKSYTNKNILVNTRELLTFKE